MEQRTTHRARQRNARRLKEPSIRFPADVTRDASGVVHATMNYSCRLCRYFGRMAHAHAPMLRGT